MPFKYDLTDRLSIEDLLLSYGHGVIQRNETVWSDCWAADSRWLLPDYPGCAEIVGKTAIVETWKGFLTAAKLPDGRPAPFFFVGSLGSLEITGDTAKVVSYTHETFPDASGNTRTVIGQYDDVCIKEGGRWKFRQRAWHAFEVGDYATMFGDHDKV
jgi:hypothetical protein